MASPKAAFNEDKVALLIGCLVFVLALGKMVGLDMMGWVVRVGMWVDNPLTAWKAATWKWLPGWGSLLLSYAIITAMMAVGTPSSAARLRVMGAMTMRFCSAILPRLTGVKSA